MIMKRKGGISYLLALVVIMAATSTTTAYGPNSQFRRDRRAIRARTMATGEDHIAHASIKMRMMNEGRSQQAVNPVRAKRFINPASGAQMNKVSDAFKEYAGNRFGPVFPGKERASELVDQIQHGYVQPPRAPFLKDAVYKDLLTRQRKDGRPSHSSRSSEKPSQMKDEVDEFLQLMREMGILGNPEENVLRGSKQQGDSNEVAEPSSAADYVSHHFHRPTINDDISMKGPSSGFGGKAESHKSSASNHLLQRQSNHEVSDVKRQSLPSLSQETENDDVEEEEVVTFQEEAIIDIPPEKLAKSDIDKHGLAGVDLEIIKELLEEILSRKSQRSANI